MDEGQASSAPQSPDELAEESGHELAVGLVARLCPTAAARRARHRAVPSFLFSPLSRDVTGAVEMGGKVAEGVSTREGSFRGKASR
jgi:hypothetical protein